MARRRKGGDTQPAETPRCGPLGDVLPIDADPDPRTPGGRLPEKVEDRLNVGSVKPEDYPPEQRSKGR